MNCDKCDFYCYEDEYICPNCEAFLKREYPADEYEKSTFIHNKIIEFNKRKKIVNLLESRKIFLIIIFIIQTIWSLWIHTFVIYRFPARTNYDIARYSIVFALTLYIIILGKPELLSNKEYAEIREPKGLIRKVKTKKIIYLSIIAVIFVLNQLIYSRYLKNLFIKDIIARKNIKLEDFGIDKLENIFTARFFIHNLGIGIIYAIHSILDITNADYFILTRKNSYRKNRKG